MNLEAKKSRSELSVSRPFFSLVRQDILRYFQLDSRDGNPGLYEKLRIFVDAPGLQAILVYRFGSWVNRTVSLRLIRYPLKLIYFILQKLCIIFWGIYIDEGAEIGCGLYVGHFGGVLIGPIQMGCDCNIAHQVTIGRGASGASGVPTIGDRVWIGAGSIIFGGVSIGDGVTIGPLTLVGRNLPPRVMVIGNPMRLLRKNYDNSEQIYGKNVRSNT